MDFKLVSTYKPQGDQAAAIQALTRGIFDRDFVLVNPSARASDGDIIAARVGTEATVKTLQHRGATIVLEPANPDERELVITPHDDFAVIGTIAAVFRPFHDASEESDEAGAPPL